jgi:hypothetical protein
MNLSVTVTLLACIGAFCAGLSVRAAWIGRQTQEDPPLTADHRDDEPYPLWFE